MAFDALQKMLWPYAHSANQVAEAERMHALLKKGIGTLTIRELRLNNLRPGQQAGIRFMSFDVVLNF